MPTTQVNGTTLAYEVNGGSGDPILLLPGLGTGMTYFKFFEPILREKMTTILVDPRGLGGSVSEDADYTAEIWADDFAALLDDLGIGSAHVLGSSHGGSMAMAMADQHPEKVKTLIVAGGFSEFNTLMEINLRMRVNLVSKLGMGPEIADHVTMWTNRADFLDTEAGKAAVETNTKAVMGANKERYIAMVRSMQHWGRVLPEQEGEPKFTTKLPTLHHPTLAITGDSDHYIPAKLSKIIADGVPNGTYREVAECGHIAVQERPKEMASEVLAFLEHAGAQK